MVPGGADEAIRFAARTCEDPAGAIRRWKALTGRPVAGCLPGHVPEEVLHAGGILPVTVWGDEPGGIRDGVDVWAAPASPDGARVAGRPPFLPGDRRPVFPFPRPGAIPGGDPLPDLLDGIEAFIEWVERVGGREVREGALDKAIRAYNDDRRLHALLAERMAETPGSFTAVEYGRLVRSGMILPKPAHAMILGSALSRGTAPGLRRGRLFACGAAVPEELLGAIDDAGVALVGEDLASGGRYHAAPADESVDAAVALARRRLVLEEEHPVPAPPDPSGRHAERTLRRAAGCGADRILILAGQDGGIGEDEARGLAARAAGAGLLPLVLTAGAGAPAGEAGRGNRLSEFLEA